MGDRVATGREIVVGGVLIVIRASLVAVTRRLVAIGPRLILITRGLIVIRPRLILIARGLVAIVRAGQELGATGRAARYLGLHAAGGSRHNLCHRLPFVRANSS